MTDQELYFIRGCEDHLFYCKGGQGTTQELEHAGLFTKAEVEQHLQRAPWTLELVPAQSLLEQIETGLRASAASHDRMLNLARRIHGETPPKTTATQPMQGYVLETMEGTRVFMARDPLNKNMVMMRFQNKKGQVSFAHFSDQALDAIWLLRLRIEGQHQLTEMMKLVDGEGIAAAEKDE